MVDWRGRWINEDEEYDDEEEEEEDRQMEDFDPVRFPFIQAVISYLWVVIRTR